MNNSIIKPIIENIIPKINIPNIKDNNPPKKPLKSPLKKPLKVLPGFLYFTFLSSKFNFAFKSKEFTNPKAFK